MRSLRVLVIDDEPPARKKLIRLLGDELDIEVVGEASDGIEAAAAIEELRPDVIFLDIQMPGLNGFEVLDAIGLQNMPAVVFVTAYDEHAVKAFEVDAADYLLKPFDRARLQHCLARLRADFAGARTSEYLRRLVVKSRERIILLKTEEVDWIESSANYVELHVGKQSYLVRETLSAIESRLDPRQFVRVHRTTMVNIDRIQELQPWTHSDFVVVLRDGTKLRMSRRFRENLAGL